MANDDEPIYDDILEDGLMDAIKERLISYHFKDGIDPDEFLYLYSDGFMTRDADRDIDPIAVIEGPKTLGQLMSEVREAEDNEPAP